MLRRCATRRVALPPTDFTFEKFAVPAYNDARAKRAKYISPVTFHMYADPLYLVQGHRQYVWDHEGNRYLDLFGGVTTVSVGHSHPRINKVINEQASRINHTTGLYMTHPMADFAEKFASKLPKSEEWIIHVVNSGSEANDFAMLMARVYTKNYQIIGLRGGYHGFTENSRGMISMPGWKHHVPPPNGLLRTLCPHPYHGVFGDDVNKYVQELDATIKYETAGKVAAFLAERIQGVGGAGELLPGYLNKAAEIVRAAGGLYISDEVQCGYGRLGSHYWGFETEGIVPDIITSAKSVANGYPVGVVACKKHVAESMRGTLYFNTFGGGAVCSRIAHETMQIIDDEKLQDNCAAFGKQLRDGLLKLQEKYPIIGHVRGKGGMQGLELVTDRATKAPAGEQAGKLLSLLKEEGMLVGKGGAGGNVLRLHPPMCITSADVDAFLAAMDVCLAKL